MSKSTTYNGVEYIFYVRTGDLYSLTPSGLPAAGPIAKAVKRGSKLYAAVLAAVA